MSRNSKIAPDPLAYLPHEGREFTGHPPVDAESPEVAEKNADKIIRQMMVEQKRSASLKSLPDLAPSVPMEAVEPAPKKVRHPRSTNPHFARVRQKLRIPKLARLSPSRGLEWLSDKVLNFRPTRTHSVVAVLALITFLRPWLIPIVLFVTFWVVLIAYLSLGPDRVAEMVVGAWRRLAARRPEMAENIRLRAESVAGRIDAIIDRLPGKWTEGLYTPDFSRSEVEDKDKTAGLDPYDRIATEAQQG